MLSLRATTLAAIAFMKATYFIGEKCVADGLKCPLCDGILHVQQLEYNHPHPVMIRGVLEPCMRTNSMGLQACCVGCGGRIHITDAMLEVLDMTIRKDRVQPSKTLTVEYYTMGLK